MKPDKIELLQEANRRGILPPEKQALYKEAVNRGLIGQQEPKMSRGEAALITSTNIPFAPRIKAGIAAGTAKGYGMITGSPVGEESLGDLYNEALRSERGKLAQARDQYPVQSIVTQLPVDILIAKGAGSYGKGLKGAMTLSGAQTIGEAEDLTDIEKTGSEGLGSALFGAATYGTLKGLQKGFNKAFTPKSPKITADQIRTQSSQMYEEAAKKGGTLKGWFMNNLIKDAEKLDKQTSIGKALSGVSPISETKEVLKGFRNKKLDLASLQELDEALGDKIDNYVENGVIKKAGLPLVKLQNSLRKLVDDISPDMVEGGREGFESLKNARKLWSKSAKLRDVERVILRAELSDNPATAIKAGFRTLASNPDKLKYFNEEERKLIKKAANSGIVMDALRTMSSRLIPIGSIVAGGGLGSAVGSQAATMASRGLATRSQLAKAENLAELIINGKKAMPKNPPSLLEAVISAKLGTLSLQEANAAEPNQDFVENRRPSKEEVRQSMLDFYKRNPSDISQEQFDLEVEREFQRLQNLPEANFQGEQMRYREQKIKKEAREKELQSIRKSGQQLRERNFYN